MLCDPGPDLRLEWRDEEVRRLFGVYEDAVMVGFGLFLIPRSLNISKFQKPGLKIRPKFPYLTF